MTGWPPADLPGLHIDCGQRSRAAGTWLRLPTADYRCGRCGWIASASGDQVPAFAAAVRDTHRATCPANRKDPDEEAD